MIESMNRRGLRTEALKVVGCTGCILLQRTLSVIPNEVLDVGTFVLDFSPPVPSAFMLQSKSGDVLACIAMSSIGERNRCCSETGPVLAVLMPIREAREASTSRRKSRIDSGPELTDVTRIEAHFMRSWRMRLGIRGLRIRRLELI